MNESGDSSRLAHEGQVLKALRRTPETSQPLLARDTGLGRGTVVSIVRRLEEKNVVDIDEVSGSSGPEGGRPAKVIRLREEAGFALAVHFGHRHVRVASGNLRGYQVFVHEKQVEPAVENEVDVGANERQSLESAVALIKVAIEENRAKGRDLSQLVAVTVSWPAPVLDRFGGRVVIDDSMRQWLGIPRPAVRLKELLGWPLDIPFFTENDANLGAMMELEHGVGKEHGDFLYAHWNSGVGGALISDQKLRRGATGLAGELGHIVLADERPAPKGCRRCGSDRCLEVLAGGTEIVRRVMVEHPRADVRSLRDVISLAQGGGALGESATRELENGARILGKALAPLVTFANPKAIVIGGHFGRDVHSQGAERSVNPYDLIGESFRSALREHAAPRALKEILVMNSSQWRYGAAQGGVVLGLQEQHPEYLESGGYQVRAG